MTLYPKFFNSSLVVFLFLILCRCAQVVPLTGGDKDVKPPELISVTPADRSVGMPLKNTRIVFKFNEMIAAQMVSQKLIINPLTEELPDVTANGKTLTVEFTKELQANTTYFLQFGNSIVDIHENNAYPNLRYMFSTGSAIDTAYITGTATFSPSGKLANGVSILLHNDLNDSAVLRSKPDYMTKADESGKFYLTAIKPGTYQFVALADKNKNNLYDAGEAIGFLDKPVMIKNDTTDLILSLSKPGNTFIKKKGQVFWGYNRYTLNDTFPNVYCISSKSIDADNFSFENRNDTLEIYYKNMYDKDLELVLKRDVRTFDTVNIHIPSKQRTDSSVANGTLKILGRVERPVYGAAYDDVHLYFNLPVNNINNAQCFLIKDGMKEKPLFSNEEKNEGHDLVTSYLPQYKKRLMNALTAGKTYDIVFPPGSIETFWGTTNKDTLKLGFKTYPADETGNLAVKLTFPDSGSTYIVQVLNEKDIVVKEITSVKKMVNGLNFYNLLPGNYSLRLIKDLDGNRKFTPANFFSRVQAEPVQYNKQPLKIIAGWDIEAVWNVK